MAKRIVFIGLIACVIFACNQPQSIEQAVRPIGAPIEITAPLGLPPVPIPADNPPTIEAIALGRRLYYERRLSSNNTLACGGCHSPYIRFTDGLRFAGGVTGKEGTRNTPTTMNAAYYLTQFWDGRAKSLEHQAGFPIANPIEMNLPHDVCVTKLSADQSYREEFEKVFGAGPITMDKLQKAIASFERTLLSGNSPFDRYQFGGDKTAMSASAIRGLAIFTDKQRGNCSTCHVIGDKFALFTDNLFHNVGAGLDSNGELKDLGRYEHTKNESERGAFRTPSLRNVAKTAPYMHDGSLKTLKDVIDFYIGGGSSNPNLDKEIKPIILSAQDRDDLIAFLESLTGELPKDADWPEKK